MIEVKGKYDSAIIYNDYVEETALSQIIQLLNQPISENSHTRIMSDVHAGAGCVIGYTAKLTDKVIPNLVGVDIGCGVSAWNLGHINVNFERLDKHIRTFIPHGHNVRNTRFKNLDFFFRKLSAVYYFKDTINALCTRLSIKSERVWNSLGSLGSGNHFCELNIDSDNNVWLVIHSGSRNLGLQTAKYHQRIAEQNTKKDQSISDFLSKIKPENRQKAKDYYLKNKISIPKELAYLENKEQEQYLTDMNIVQMYAKVNRRIMGHEILRFFDIDYHAPTVESIHNYIDFSDNIIRKGSISAYTDDKVIIPLNMADGCILGTGKSNGEWNFSAPHGAGRKMSRSKAKEKICMDDFENSMKDVWSSCVKKSTLDEAPQAYKDGKEIIEYIKETVTINDIMKPIYNFKAN